MELTWKHMRRAICAAALIIVSADVASAAPARLVNNTNLRQGPGTNFGVTATLPRGSLVNVIRCSGEWCNVTVGGRPGYMIARNLGRSGRVIARRVVTQPAVVVAQPAPVVVVGSPYYYGYGPGFYYGPRYRYWRRW